MPSAPYEPHFDLEIEYVPEHSGRRSRYSGLRAICIGNRYSVILMTKKISESTSRTAGVAYLILTSLADGEKHGYALTQDVVEFAGVRIAPGSLYEALARLEGQGLIEPVASSDRRRPYKLTAMGAGVLDEYFSAQERLATEGRRRLRASWRFA